MLQEIQSTLSKNPFVLLALLTTVIIIIYYSILFIILKNIETSDITTEGEKLISKKRIKFYGRMILILAIFSLWFSQLQSVFVSVIAFAAALVLAFKELIMCVTGGFLIRINKQFSMGNRIEVDGIRGFVIEKSITATKVLEIGPEKNSQQTTGNIIAIPNSVFLSKAATNQSYFQNYSIRSFVFSPSKQSEFEKSEQVLLDIANAICTKYLKKAKDSISKFCKKEGILIPTVEPRVKLLLSEENEAKLLLKLPVDNQNISEIEQRIHREYYNFLVQENAMVDKVKEKKA